jgi:hypothetical protein
MIHLTEREIIVCKRLAENKAEVFLDGTVIDVDRARRITEPAVFFGTFQMKEEGAKLRYVGVFQGNAIGFLKPCAAFKDRLKIAVDRTGTIIDQFQDIGNALEFRFVKWRIRVLHVLSFRSRFTGTSVKLFRRRGTSTLEMKDRIKYTHLA